MCNFCLRDYFTHLSNKSFFSNNECVWHRAMFAVPEIQPKRNQKWDSAEPYLRIVWDDETKNKDHPIELLQREQELMQKLLFDDGYNFSDLQTDLYPELPTTPTWWQNDETSTPLATYQIHRAELGQPADSIGVPNKIYVTPRKDEDIQKAKKVYKSEEILVISQDPYVALAWNDQDFCYEDVSDQYPNKNVQSTTKDNNNPSYKITKNENEDEGKKDVHAEEIYNATIPKCIQSSAVIHKITVTPKIIYPSASRFTKDRFNRKLKSEPKTFGATEQNSAWPHLSSRRKIFDLGNQEDEIAGKSSIDLPTLKNTLEEPKSLCQNSNIGQNHPLPYSEVDIDINPTKFSSEREISTSRSSMPTRYEGTVEQTVHSSKLESKHEHSIIDEDDNCCTVRLKEKNTKENREIPQSVIVESKTNEQDQWKFSSSNCDCKNEMKSGDISNARDSNSVDCGLFTDNKLCIKISTTSSTEDDSIKNVAQQIEGTLSKPDKSTLQSIENSRKSANKKRKNKSKKSNTKVNDQEKQTTSDESEDQKLPSDALVKKNGKTMYKRVLLREAIEKLRSTFKVLSNECIIPHPNPLVPATETHSENESPNDTVVVNNIWRDPKFTPKQCTLRFNTYCTWIGHIDFLGSHVKKCHPSQYYTSNNQKMFILQFWKKTQRKYFAFFNLFNNFFRLSYEIDAANGKVTYGMYYLKSVPNFGEYCYEIVILKKLNKILRIKSPCYYMENDDETFLPDSFVKLPYDIIKDCTDNTDNQGHLYFIVKVYKS